MNKETFVFGIDPGLASLGWGVLRIDANDASIAHIAHGVIQTNSKDSLGNRLLQIGQQIDSICARYPVSVLAYEKQFFVKNVTSGLQVAHALGVVLFYGAKQGLIVEDYSPKEIKLQVTGNANAKKESVQRFVCLQLGLDEVKVHHAADAIGAALCYCYRLNSIKLI